MAYNYTDTQIQEVCIKASDVMKDFTVPQNCTFPTTEIIKGMKAELTPDEIADNAYYAVADLPLHQTGFGLVGMGDNMHTVASYMRGAIFNAITDLNQYLDSNPN